MNLPLLALLLAVGVVAFPESSLRRVSGLLGDPDSVLKLKDANTTTNKALHMATIVKIWKRFRELRGKILRTLVLTPKQRTAFAKKLKTWERLAGEHMSSAGNSIDEINKKSGIGRILFQGDVLLTKAQAERIADDIENDQGSRMKRQAFRDKHYPQTIWSKGVYYYFDFNTNPDRIRVHKGDGCWSQLGRVGGQQDLSLGNNCETVGIAAHEIGHSLGLFHMHARYDRDNFITVNAENIDPEWIEQYAKETRLTNDNYGITYDYGGIMQYDVMSSSRNGRPTMLPHDMGYVETLGSGIISFYELFMINKHYGCLARCSGRPNLCMNRGFPNPRNCSKCVCPSGYGGDHCNQKPSGCGTVLQASSTPKTFTDTIGSNRMAEREDYKFCYYWIEAPLGSLIEVKIKSFSGGLFDFGCTFAGVEIKTQKDQRRTGYRFCSHTDAGRTLVSKSNRVPIITYNRWKRSTTVIEYRTVGGSFTTPQPSSTTTHPPNPATCMDKPSCPARIIWDFCENAAFSVFIKRIICAKSCGFCE
uniref:Metalloendopeptidase n=1 Tax=Haemonchus contortus TaxID=6289 RepID=A0A7I4Z5G6_HAECO